jgi:hypothetical protein
LAAAAPVTSKSHKEADGTHTLVHEVVVPAPPAKVWEAIATAEGWKTWAVPFAWAPQPDLIETSYTQGAAPGDPGTIRQRLIARIPAGFSSSVPKRRPPAFPNFDTYAKVTSIFELEPAGTGKTRVD